MRGPQPQYMPVHARTFPYVSLWGDLGGSGGLFWSSGVDFEIIYPGSILDRSWIDSGAPGGSLRVDWGAMVARWSCELIGALCGLIGGRLGRFGARWGVDWGSTGALWESIGAHFGIVLKSCLDFVGIMLR